MERNWLIRTTQNQILGPVAKAKLLEFLKKGALGLNDEVCSGNGYWFSLKEKDLVEKYLNGDLPQGYNPISESKSVLSKRDYPDRTTSINTAPANATQVIKLAELEIANVPKNEDLEYPDLAVVQKASSSVNIAGEDVKLPNQNDLEFPDITLSGSQVQDTLIKLNTKPSTSPEPQRLPEIKQRQPIEIKNSQVDDTQVNYPKDDDLEFPDMAMASAIEKDEDLEFKVEFPQKEQQKQEGTAQTVLVRAKRTDFKNEFEDGSGLSLAMDSAAHEEPSRAEPKSETRPVQKRERPAPAERREHEEKKLLHERKLKTQSSSEKPPKPEVPRAMPEHLKKRNDNYLMYILVILILIILSLFFYYYRAILNKPLPV